MECRLCFSALEGEGNNRFDVFHPCVGFIKRDFVPSKNVNNILDFTWFSWKSFIQAESVNSMYLGGTCVFRKLLLMLCYAQCMELARIDFLRRSSETDLMFLILSFRI